MNQKTTVFKKSCKESKKIRRKKEMEGTTYESGIGLNNEHAALLVQSLLEQKDDPQPEMEEWRKARCFSAPNFVSLVREENIVSSSMIYGVFSLT